MWGRNAQGELGQNNTTYYSSPVQIPGTTWSKGHASGSRTNIAAKTDGTLWSWGYNNYGNMGVNSSSNYFSSPVQIGSGTDWSTDYQKIINGKTGSISVAIKTDGTAWAWGGNNVGQLGLNDTIARSSPTQIPGTDFHTGGVAENTLYIIKRSS